MVQAASGRSRQNSKKSKTNGPSPVIMVEEALQPLAARFREACGPWKTPDSG
jgi:hypothetical protein